MLRAVPGVVFLVVVGLFLVSLPFACRRPAGAESYPKLSILPRYPRNVRVTLEESADRVKLEVKGRFVIKPRYSELVLMRGERLRGSVVRPAMVGVVVGTTELKAGSIEIEPLDGTGVYVDGTPYRGRVIITRLRTMKLLVVNELDVEDYVAEVVGSELPSGWHTECLKAQAIAVRTFIMFRMVERHQRLYDIRTYAGEMAFRGMKGEREDVRRAVRETRGLVMLYDWKLFPAYYSSVCGGHTASPQNAFGLRSILPLSGVECAYCRNAPRYHWKAEFSASEVGKFFGMGTIRRVRVLSRDSSGRVEKIELSDRTNQKTVNGARFRMVCGADRVLSTLFEVRLSAGKLSIEGRGWGHGVGMCQWGAEKMATEGYSASSILSHYYTGASIVKLYDGS